MLPSVHCNVDVLIQAGLEYRPGVWRDCTNRGRGLLLEEIRYAMSLLCDWIRLYLYWAGTVWLKTQDLLLEFQRYLSQFQIDICTSCLGGHIATSRCRSSSQSFRSTFFELVVIENLTVAVVNHHIICFFLLKHVGGFLIPKRNTFA